MEKEIIETPGITDDSSREGRARVVAASRILLLSISPIASLLTVADFMLSTLYDSRYASLGLAVST